MIHFSLNVSQCDSSRLGAARAQADFTSLRDQISSASGQPQIVVIDFAGIEHTNASYIRSGPYWFFACGRAWTTGGAQESGDAWAVRPLPVIPLVTNLSPEVREAVDEVFYVRNSPCLEVVDATPTAVHKARLLGALEPKLYLSIVQFCSYGREATAAELHTQFSAGEDIGVTAWNNRLAELHALLLVRRRKQGKFWHYQPITQGIQDGRGPRT